MHLAQSIDFPESRAAIKILKPAYLKRGGSSAAKAVCAEVDILCSLDHPGIIRLYEASNLGRVTLPSTKEVMSNLVFLVMEHVDGCDLMDHCLAMGAMGEEVARFFMWQLVNIFGYMHSRNVVHRDLKPDNILVDRKLNLKLVDFGFACSGNISAFSEYLGTCRYMAPEIHEGKAYNGKQVDVFALGVVLFILATGKFPFEAARKSDGCYKWLIENPENFFAKADNQGLSTELKDLLVSLLAYDGNMRPSIAEIKTHPWMNKAGFDYEKTRDSTMAWFAAKD